MKSLLEWFDAEGFYVKQAWDLKTEEWLNHTPGNPVKLQLFDFQRRVLEHVFTFKDKRLPYDQVVWSTIKKSGKSTIGSMVASWVADEYPGGSEIYVVANALEQARSRQFTDIAHHYLVNGIDTNKLFINLPNGSFIQALANQATTAAGSRHCLSLWDEIWGIQSDLGQLMWAEMTPPPTIPNAFRMITTYAGFENQSKQLWDLYEMGWLKGEVIPELSDLVNMKGEPICRRNGRLFVMWDDVPRFPWQTEEYYSSQLAQMRPSDFLRVHRNMWVSSSETFLPIEAWDKAATKLEGQLLLSKDDPNRKYMVCLGIDIGTKFDSSAVVGTYYNTETHRPAIAFHRIWLPSKEEAFDIENTVEAFVEDVWRKLNVAAVGYDPSQFHRSAVTLSRKGIPMVEFPQTASNMTTASQTLYDLLTSNGIDAYPSEELRDHLKYASAKFTERGFRIMKEKHAKYKIDAAVAMAMSLHLTVQESYGLSTEKITIASPFADVSSVRIPTITDIAEMKFPPELRG